MTILPHFLFVFESLLSLPETRMLLKEALEKVPLRRIDNANLSHNSLRFVVDQESFLYINSFLPVIDVRLYELNSGTKVEVSFKLKPTIKVILYVFVVLSIMFEIALLVFYFSRTLSVSTLLCLPILLVLFMLILSYFGLKFSSKPFVNLISDILDRKTKTE